MKTKKPLDTRERSKGFSARFMQALHGARLFNLTETLIPLLREPVNSRFYENQTPSAKIIASASSRIVFRLLRDWL
jgi:hypothetical protein